MSSNTLSNGLQFVVGSVDGCGFRAVSNVEPYFCIERDTAKEAIDVALAAWSFYLSVKGEKKIKTFVKKTSPFKSVTQHFTPSEVVLAQVC